MHASEVDAVFMLLYAPAPQATQTTDAVAELKLLYFPLEQAAQPVVPVVRSLYVPKAHDVHPSEVVPRLTPIYEPAAQVVHTRDDEAPTTLLYMYENAHAVQALAPSVGALYLPATHGRQAPVLVTK